MDQLQQFVNRSKLSVYGLTVTTLILIILLGWLGLVVLELNQNLVFGGMVVLALFVPFLTVQLVTRIFVAPLQTIWQAVLSVSPGADVAAPDTSQLHHAQELVTNLANHVYQLADVGKQAAVTAAAQTTDLHHNFIATNLPLPFVVLDKEQNVSFANAALLDYIGRSQADIEGQKVYSVLDLSFTNDDTFETWLQTCQQNAVTATQTWQRARLTIANEAHDSRLFDLVAYYNKNNSDGYETMVLLVDRTKEYAKQDQAIGFVALAVHELRTPLTIMRGSIEALDEELAGKLTPELTSFLQRTQVSAGQLATFVNNILNVARIDDDQMIFTLQEEKWQDILPGVVQELAMRAYVHGITLKIAVAPDLPAVGVDRVSLYEVMSNLVDNAIKYSQGGKEIIITSQLNPEGYVETSVQDFGAGIPTSAMPQLFTRFYRDHHNKAVVTGTGIGLYLCKTFITAHGGNIWVRSKEGEGSTFSFTLVPYAQLAQDKKNPDNNDITRSAHGWIKNHSLYRR